MREIQAADITEAIARMAREAGCVLGDDEVRALERALEMEESPQGKSVLEQLLKNAQLAAENETPLCQDTGLALVFLDVGQEATVVGGDLSDAVNEGIRRGYEEGLLRASMVTDPLLRENSGDNTPAVIHTRIVPGDQLDIIFDAKGGGCENMSVARVLKPSDGTEGVIEFVVDRIVNSGGNPCPPLVVGVGIGGSFERSAEMAKRSLMRPLGNPNPEAHLAELERDLLEHINATGIGPMGLGGKVTALAVHVETGACHIASLPVAVNLDCHSHRHRHTVL